jgi:7-cyano-7-deazaguanine reductase
MNHLQQSALGKVTSYVDQYDPKLLFPIPRQINRQQLGLTTCQTLPFTGWDIWNGFELCWLNPKGKPVVATGCFIFPCNSPAVVESKSFKLYLHSFNNTPFASVDEVKAALIKDLTMAAQAPVQVDIMPIKDPQADFMGQCLDDLDISFDTYSVEPDFLMTESQPATIEERVYSNLLKSNCPVTHQPDWGTVQIHYQGQPINHSGLLRYIVSFRNHNEFHEHCVERIFSHIMARCKPNKLTVYARYTRRGGLEINPYRSTETSIMPANTRLARQ